MFRALKTYIFIYGDTVSFIMNFLTIDICREGKVVVNGATSLYADQVSLALPAGPAAHLLTGRWILLPNPLCCLYSKLKISIYGTDPLRILF